MILEMMRTRDSFVNAVRGKKVVTPGFVLQAFARNDGEEVARNGFTCSKKVGNAVERNLAKRRLREVAREVLPDLAQPGWDYVLIGRTGETSVRSLPLMQDELRSAMDTLHPGTKLDMDGLGLG